MLSELLRYSRRNDSNAVACPEDVPNFPVQTLEEFQQFDTRLEKSFVLREYMVSRLAGVGGSGVESLTRHILKYLLSNEVAILYNWKGRDKLPFERTNVMKIIYEAARVTFAREKKNDLTVANSVKVWLKLAKTRMLNSHKRLAKMDAST